MRVEDVLSKLEQDANEKLFSINAPITTPPPSTSSFYWKNCSEDKYKVFIPTEEGIVYWNFEEYNWRDIRNNTRDENWRTAKKCIQLAVSNTPEGELVNRVMNAVLNKSFGRYENDSFEPEETEYMPNLKYYRLYKYYVRDIQGVQMEDRHNHATNYVEMVVSPYDEDDQKFMDLISYAFKTIAEYFRKNERRQVHCYSRRSNYYY